MKLRRWRGWLGLVVAPSIVAGPWPGAPATATCAAPYLRIADDLPAPSPGSAFVVEGRAFVDGCNDNEVTTVLG